MKYKILTFLFYLISISARAKFLKAKRMATQHDPARLNEILGIKA